jgi:integrase
MAHSSYQRGYVSDAIRTRKGTAYVIRYRIRKTDGTWIHNSGFHCFRHSAGSFVNSQTGNLKLAQKLLGHSRYETTANVYTHALSGDERVAALAVEEAIFGSCSHLFSNENNKGPKSVN